MGGDFLRSHTSLHTSQWNGGWVRYPALDVEAPQTPSQVWADGSGEEEIELRWSAVSDAVAYEVLRDDRVIAHSDLIGGGESTSVTFPVSAIQGDGFKTLDEGQKVSFEITQGSKGPQASDVEKI